MPIPDSLVITKATVNSLQTTSHDINECITEQGGEIPKRSSDISDVYTVKPLLVMFSTSLVKKCFR